MDLGVDGTFSAGHVADGLSLDLVGDAVPSILKLQTVLVEDVMWKMGLEEAGAQ